MWCVSRVRVMCSSGARAAVSGAEACGPVHAVSRAVCHHQRLPLPRHIDCQVSTHGRLGTHDATPARRERRVLAGTRWRPTSGGGAGPTILPCCTLVIWKWRVLEPASVLKGKCVQVQPDLCVRL